MRWRTFAPMKRTILSSLERKLSSQLAEATARVRSLMESLEAEAKSTAGDKHETGRAMIHQEIEAVQATVDRTADQVRLCRRWANEEGSFDRVAPGALVETDGPWVFVGLGLGRLELEAGEVLSISPASPLAEALRGKRVGDAVVLGGIRATVRAIH